MYIKKAHLIIKLDAWMKHSTWNQRVIIIIKKTVAIGCHSSQICIKFEKHFNGLKIHFGRILRVLYDWMYFGIRNKNL